MSFKLRKFISLLGSLITARLHYCTIILSITLAAPSFAGNSTAEGIPQLHQRLSTSEAEAQIDEMADAAYDLLHWRYYQLMSAAGSGPYRQASQSCVSSPTEKLGNEMAQLASRADVFTMTPGLQFVAAVGGACILGGAYLGSISPGLDHSAIAGAIAGAIVPISGLVGKLYQFYRRFGPSETEMNQRVREQERQARAKFEASLGQRFTESLRNRLWIPTDVDAQEWLASTTESESALYLTFRSPKGLQKDVKDLRIRVEQALKTASPGSSEETHLQGILQGIPRIERGTSLDSMLIATSLYLQAKRRYLSAEQGTRVRICASVLEEAVVAPTDTTPATLSEAAPDPAKVKTAGNR